MRGDRGRTVLLVALSAVMSCAFESRPSLGWHDPDAGPKLEEPPPPPPSAHGGEPEVTPEPPSDRESIDASDTSLRRDASADPSDDAGAPPPPAAGATAPSPPQQACPVGTYSVELTCVATVTGAEMIAPAAFTFERGSNGALATVTGDIGFFFSGALFAATVSGELDCTSGAFHATLVNGAFVFVVAPVPMVFDGWFSGQLDPVTRRFVGDWWYGVPLGGCPGTWTARPQP